MLWAVIMAGGSGTRFWPESRIKKPKQFLKIFGRTTLLEQTARRLRPLVPSGRILVVTQKENVPLAHRLLKIPVSQIIGEPVGRNTAPCAVLAAFAAIKRDPRAVLALLPADHRIEKEGKFRKALAAACAIASDMKMPVTFGIRPSYPHTGYGYLETGACVQKTAGFPLYRLKRFCEKPDLATAKKFFKSKRYLWNAGIFVWDAEALLETARRYEPEIYDLAKKISEGPFENRMKKLFPKMPGISIDYALMEKLGGRILTIPLDAEWNDLGGWQVFPGIWPEDSRGNVVLGKAILKESCGNIVKSGERLVALLGVRDLVVVDSGDALLVCHKQKTESVRQIVDELREKKWKKYL